MMQQRPVAYIRRSFSRRNDPGDRSREFQVNEVRRLAGADAPDLVVKDRDWGVSAAREETHRRLDFLDMLEMIERGEISTVYAYSVDRLARSVQWSARLLDACEDAGTTIVTGEGRYDPADDGSRTLYGFTAIQNEAALRQMRRKAQATIAVRRERKDHLGPAPYGTKVVDGKLVDNPDERVAILEAAYRAAGSLQGAARRLNAQKVATRSGKPWRATTLRGILGRSGALPRRPARGRPPARDYLFARLLRCHCGAMMTGRANTKGRRGFAYECKQAALTTRHGRSSVSEALLTPAIQAEAARLTTPDAVNMDVVDVEVRRSELLERRERVTETYLDPRSGMTREKRDAEWDAIDGALDTLDTIDNVEVVPSIDWSWETRKLNAVLRALWERVELGPDLLPCGFGWRVPEWRS